MSNITLAEAVKLKSVLTKRIHELEVEMRRVAFTTVEKGSNPVIGPRPLTVVESELDEVRSDSRLLDRLMYRANIDHTIEFQGQQLAIVEAIELATQLRAKARFYKELSMSEKEEIQYGYSEGTIVYRVALFDPEDYRLKSLQAEKDAHKLSNSINAKNYSIVLAFDDAKYF
ncbi:hypothetical protein [Sporosarcina sp. JAI121]|uniref:hypothetical protein n=1 Tax=Sporosarcina sp. JAI121 TaxID=2723064 RepID=UPI0015CDFB2D|nr:hypothetical protein [Sporosarcina sp. JAI121]NYF25972.1 hypothetical protein [Sporosarcina sp. JAI121]